MVFLKDSIACVQKWAKPLKTGGKLIFNAQTYDSMILGRCFDVVKQELNMFILYGSETASGTLEDKLSRVQAVPECWETKVNKGGDLFEGFLDDGSGKEWDEPGVKERAKDSFYRELAKRAKENEKVKSYCSFNVAIEVKV
ncbi:uncharacterized protein RAG0_07059 [Rhynchosporium agropyri]|uniref:Uncharacterized protein n=1 Tax=Rhynchosporium agropyri TaxID=914238 RepID=A0A1E1KJX6_9HELO|nr:uncharacterized protein RAG0_07059 [Rhynchosporium agropyri]